MRVPYRHDLKPPFPTLVVNLRNRDLGLEVLNLSALLDTGADATLVPVDLLRQVSASEIVESSVKSHWGDVRLVRLYLVDLEIGVQVLPSVIVVGDEFGGDVILGRDVLNKLRIYLDGPNRETQLR